MSRVDAGRNDPCPCGSGKKFKKCCEGKQQGWSTWAIVALIGFGLILALGVWALWGTMTSGGAEAPAAGRVWSPEHGHWHD